MPGPQRTFPVATDPASIPAAPAPAGPTPAQAAGTAAPPAPAGPTPAQAVGTPIFGSGWVAGRMRRHGWAAGLGLVLGLLALGPALGRGFVLTYDMVFVPDPPISLADLGASGGPARAVPSDLIVALASRVIPAQIFQKIILILIFVVACAGACALAERLPVLARVVAGVCFTWNPFVAERLIMGQWAMLLGYAGLPWVVRELAAGAGRGGQGSSVRLGRFALAMVPAAVGGFAAMSITVVAAVPAAWFGAEAGVGWAGRARRTGIAASVLVVASLPFVIPSLLVPVQADPAGAAVFAARADTPFGAVGSLLMLGGIWNSQAEPSGYGGAVSVCWLIVVLAAVVGYVLVARRRRIAAGLGVAAAVGLCVASVGTWSVSLGWLKDAISFWPGFALLRDGQQFVAPLALAESIGLAAGVAAVISAAQKAAAKGGTAKARSPGATGTRATRPGSAGAARPGSAGPGNAGPGNAGPGNAGPGSARPGSARRGLAGPGIVLGVVALLAPVLLLPGLAWGAVGRLRAVEYPADWITASKMLDGSREAGSVVLLPWAEYRQYPWNHEEPVYDPWPRMLARPVIWNNELTVGRTTVAAESQSALQLGPAIRAPGPLTFRLLAAGVRYVVVDAGPLLGRPRARLATLARLPDAQVVLASRDLIVFRLPARPPT